MVAGAAEDDDSDETYYDAVESLDDLALSMSNCTKQSELAKQSLTVTEASPVHLTLKPDRRVHRRIITRQEIYFSSELSGLHPADTPAECSSFVVEGGETIPRSIVLLVDGCGEAAGQNDQKKTSIESGYVRLKADRREHRKTIAKREIYFSTEPLSPPGTDTRARSPSVRTVEAEPSDAGPLRNACGGAAGPIASETSFVKLQSDRREHRQTLTRREIYFHTELTSLQQTDACGGAAGHIPSEKNLVKLQSDRREYRKTIARPEIYFSMELASLQPTNEQTNAREDETPTAAYNAGFNKNGVAVGQTACMTPSNVNVKLRADRREYRQTVARREIYFGDRLESLRPPAALKPAMLAVDHSTEETGCVELQPDRRNNRQTIARPEIYFGAEPVFMRPLAAAASADAGRGSLAADSSYYRSLHGSDRFYQD